MDWAHNMLSQSILPCKKMIDFDRSQGYVKSHIYCIVLHCIVFGLHYTSLVPYCIATAGSEKC